MITILLMFQAKPNISHFIGSILGPGEKIERMSLGDVFVPSHAMNRPSVASRGAGDVTVGKDSRWNFLFKVVPAGAAYAPGDDIKAFTRMQQAPMKKCSYLGRKLPYESWFGSYFGPTEVSYQVVIAGKNGVVRVDMFKPGPLPPSSENNRKGRLISTGQVPMPVIMRPIEQESEKRLRACAKEAEDKAIQIYEGLVKLIDQK